MCDPLLLITCILFLCFHKQVTVSTLWKLRGHFETSRRLLKKMGDSAGVGIEPAEQTRLCDATALLPGVVAAGVPGAGGVDAIFAIT